MSLSARLTLALSAAALLLFSAVGTWQLRAEEEDLQRAVERDLRYLGRSLQVSFENALRDAQQEDVQETLRELERSDPEVDVLLYDGSGALLAASTGAVPRPHPPASRPRETELRFLPDADPIRAELIMPLQIGRGTAAATLVVVRPLDAMHADLAATRLRVVLSVAGFVALVALLTMTLARIWVGGPLARMVRHMQRVRVGDLSPSKLPARRDEVGQTLREFEMLVSDLRETRSRLESEAEARQRLEQGLREVDKLATVGQLAAGLAHEIGSPLQILEGRVAALDAKADEPAETRRIARIVLAQTERITRIVSRLSDVARRPPGRTRVFDPVPPVRLVVDLLEGEARRRGVVLALSSEDQLPPIEGDPDSVQQLTLNLVRNALQASARGGRVEVSLSRGTVSSLHGRSREGVRLEVKDDGAGMDEETRARAFETFFTTRAAEGGSGLGLAVVKGIVDELGGRVELRSEPGRGTTVVADLPTPALGPQEAR